MVKRYYVSNIIGNGTDEDPFRPKVADYGVSWVGSIPTDANGIPVYADCLTVVNAEDHSALRKDAAIDAMPDFPLDGKVSAIQTSTKNAMMTALAVRGFDTSNLGNADGYRDVIQAIGQQRDPLFNVDKFDVR